LHTAGLVLGMHDSREQGRRHATFQRTRRCQSVGTRTRYRVTVGPHTIESGRRRGARVGNMLATQLSESDC